MSNAFDFTPEQYVWFGGYAGAAILLDDERRWRQYVLDDAALVGGINKLYKEKIRRKNSIPKYQVYNTALLTAQKNTTFNEIQLQPEEWGRHVESGLPWQEFLMIDPVDLF